MGIPSRKDKGPRDASGALVSILTGQHGRRQSHGAGLSFYLLAAFALAVWNRHHHGLECGISAQVHGGQGDGVLAT